MQLEDLLVFNSFSSSSFSELDSFFLVSDSCHSSNSINHVCRSSFWDFYWHHHSLSSWHGKLFRCKLFPLRLEPGPLPSLSMADPKNGLRGAGVFVA